MTATNSPTCDDPSHDRLLSCLLAVAAGFLLLRVWESRGLVAGYDAHVYWAGARAFVHGADPYAIDTFVVPPSGLIPIALLGWLQFKVAYAILQLAAAGAMTFALAQLIVAIAGISHRAAMLVGLSLVTWSAPTFQTFGFGNLNGLILLAWVMCLLASRRGDERRAGLWFGVGLALKPVLGPIGLVLLIQRRWRLAAWSMLPPAVLTGIALALGGGTGFVRDSLPSITRGFDQRFNRADMSIRAVGYRHHLPAAVTAGLRVLAVLVALGVAVLVWRAAMPAGIGDVRSVRLLEVGTVVMLGTLLAAPFGWRYYGVFLLPWLVHLVCSGWTKQSPLMVLGWALLLLPDSLGLQYDAAGAPTVNRDRPTVAVAILLMAAGAHAWTAPHKPPRAS